MDSYNWIVIGRRADDLLQYLPAERVGVFDSVKAFDHWRKQAAQAPVADTIALDVATVLNDLGRTIDEFDGEVRMALETLASCKAVPPVRNLVPDGISESTFYRRWRSAFPLTPKQFAMSVRYALAERLTTTEASLPVEEAAYRAGFQSPWHLREWMKFRDETPPPRQHKDDSSSRDEDASRERPS